MRSSLTSLALMLLAVTNGLAQDLGDLRDQKPFAVHGSLGAGMEFYQSNEAYPTRPPFAWNVYGSLTPSVYGVTMPVTFVVTQYGKSYAYPFAQVGISPAYKWVRLHLGYRTILFSPLVFAGQSFLGAGVELSPKGFYLGGFYGRLNRAVQEDTSFAHPIEPQYARVGYGLKLGVGTPKNNFNISFFHAKDEIGSIKRLQDSLTTVLPQENTVVGSSWHFTFFHRLVWSGDLAAGLLNRDQSYQEIDSVGYYKIPTLMKKLMPVNWSSVFSYAGQSQVSFTWKTINASAGYRRIAPDFVSLGVPYMLNDLEMVNGAFGGNFFKGRLNTNLAFTTQHNNLSHLLASTLVTRTGNLAVNAFVSQHFNLSATMTGAQVYQRDGASALSDSVRMDQLMFSVTVAPTLNFTGNDYQHTISASLSYTALYDHNPATSALTAGNNISTSLNYALYFSHAFWGLNAAILYNRYGQGDNRYQSAGINAGLNAQLLGNHQLALLGSAGYFLNKYSSSPAGNNTTFSFTGNYTLQHHSVGVYLNYVLTPPVNLNPLTAVYHIPIAVNSKNFAGGIMYGFHF
ncbi:MAG TPA: hypothetical protein VN616_01260 [Puia sp.]|nr:hypothetical protein [Puia sp.]